MFLDTASPAPRAGVAKDVAALLEAEPDLESRTPREVAFVLTAQDVAREARLLAPALRACRALGDAPEVFLLPTHEDSPLHRARETARRILGIEHVEMIPSPRPASGRGSGQREMRHAYRTYELLKRREPDIVVSTQALGAPCFAMRARALGVCLRRTRFVVVLKTFDLQRRLNERLITSRLPVLARFSLERAVAERADVCVAPSNRFVENAVRTGAVLEAGRIAVLPEIDVSGADPTPLRPSGFVIPDAPPIERNVLFFSTLAKRHSETLRNAEGRIRLRVDATERNDKIAALCERCFAGTEVAWSIGARDDAADVEDDLFFVPYCEDFFALGGALAPAVHGAPVLMGTGAAVGEAFEAEKLSVPPFPDAVAEAIAEAARGRRALRIAARPADLDASWTRLLANLAAPEPAEVPGTPPVTVCLMHFNRPKIVEAALSSALGQTYERIETLIFDDGSDAPGAVEALETLVRAHGARVRLVRRDNRYLGAARNRAARAARGEYVYFLDDDNVLKPHAIETLVRAAQTSGADFVGSFSDVFKGDEAPDPDAVAEQRIQHVGDDSGFSLLANLILDGNALCRRDAFLDLGGNTEDYGIGKDDQEFFARALRSGQDIAVVPEALFWARYGHKGLKSLHISRNAGHFRVLQAYWPLIDPRYRGMLLLLQGMGVERLDTPARKPVPPEPPGPTPQERMAQAIVLAGSRSRFGNGRAEGREVVGVSTAPATRRARGLVSAVESHPQAEVRGWVLDPADSERSRTVAVLVEERLLEVVAADKQRNDIARWRGTNGRHGFRWRIPEGLAAKDGMRIDVFDAETGRLLSGSPVRIEGGRAIASTRSGT